jgi:hypothetical protein
MTETPSWTAGLLLLGSLLGIGAILWGTRPRMRRKKTALLVLSGAKSTLEPKVAVLTELLYRRVTAQGFAARRVKRAAATSLRDEPRAGASAALHGARAVGADYVLVVSMDDLSCQVDESRMGDLEALRVNTTLCVAYQVVEILSGRLLLGQTLALCRTTSPIVNGTSVGSHIIDGLLDEVADRIGENLGSLHLDLAA